MSETVQRLNAAVIGCGAIGQLHAQTLADSACASLRAVCDLDAQKAKRCGARFGVPAFVDFHELMRDDSVDVVTIATPNNLHVAPVEAALECGLHVFCEKPLATDTRAACRLRTLAAENGRQLAVDYNRRFGFGYQQAKRWLAAGEIGRLRQITFHVADKIPPPHVAIEEAVMLSSLLVHHFDLVRHFGGEVEQVNCLALPPRAGLVQNLHVNLTLGGGILASVQGDYRDGLQRTSEQAIFSGDEGEIRVQDVTRSATLSRLDPDQRMLLTSPQFQQGDAFSATISEHLESFLDSVARGEPVQVDANDGVEGLLIGEAARLSLREQRVVEMHQVRGHYGIGEE